jgi:hypothetical protein
LTRTSIKIPALVDLDEVLENSYRDFHAKGFDYLCLRRTPERTVKAYFFEGDVAQAPEVIAPHDHRYSFRTEVLTGSVVNRLYQPVLSETPDAEPYELFDYATPLNGGDGFTWKKLAWLSRMPLRLYGPGDTYSMRATEVHTIRIAGPETILLLDQGPDILPLSQPTSCYRMAGAKEPPSLDELYSKMDADHATKRIRQLFRALGRLEAAA